MLFCPFVTLECEMLKMCSEKRGVRKVRNGIFILAYVLLGGYPRPLPISQAFGEPVAFRTVGFETAS